MNRRGTVSPASITIISPEAAKGRNVVAYGLTKALSSRMKTAILRPVACRKEMLTDTLIAASSSPELSAEICRGTCPCKATQDASQTRADALVIHDRVVAQTRPDMLLVVGSDHSKVFDPEIMGLNADIAADLRSPVLLVVCTIGREPRQVMKTVQACRRTVEASGTALAGVFVSGCEDGQKGPLQEAFGNYDRPVWTVSKIDFDADPAAKQVHEEAYRAFIKDVDLDQVLKAVEESKPQVTTPAAFQNDLLARAKSSKKTIVLPEGGEDRIIKAADYLLARDIVDLIIVGDKQAILARGQELGLNNLGKAAFQAMDDENVLKPMTERLCELRAKKGMTHAQARKQLTDASYFGTMLVVLGKADGLVSGSINSTANTVRPALQVIKTRPDASLVSGAFLMCFHDHVAVFADCAINLNPNAEQLADIAIQSAQTAKSFGIDPKVGMLSYSTLGSGKGPDVDLVEEATRLAKKKAPDLPIVGSIQFDAAWSPTVAAAKAKDDPVAGKVNVFVFPDLSAGNICYKAVQRTSGALAIGPVLQGLNRPVNDLSRGALVADIINTVALTAIEAQQN
ncbi:phosphate acetyltransferase [Bifidobacterium asteroides]|uniref:phosphate acetyltransferase n=1 Tax=Bifidobacterium asteroides TaxID=1684 RepID=UPI001C69F5A2|nr:phosphate acetyltransferase [Bifidobacterium asteroides]QYN60538.1 phosphate acetyltransferase [Bifidobacterium asteroides]